MACAAEKLPEFEPRIDGLELLYAISRTDESVVGGLRDAVPSLAVIVVRSSTGAVLVKTIADKHGRFHSSLPKTARSPVSIQVNEAAAVEFRIRDFEAASTDAVGIPINGLGHIPNDLVVLSNGTFGQAIVVRSGDNAISKIDLQTTRSRGVRLPELMSNDGRLRPANPWFVKALSQDQVFVTAFGQDRVFLVDMARESVIETMALTESVILPEAHVLSREIDINRDGVLDHEVKQFKPRGAQALFVTDEQLVVAFSGFVSPRLDADRAAVYLPSVLAFWSLDNLSASPKYLVLPQRNAQEISLSHDGDLLVSCSGVIESVGGVLQATSESSVVKIDARTRTITETINLGGFGASSTVDIDGHRWTSSLLRAQLQNIDSRQIVELNQEPVDSVFRLLVLPGKLFAAPSFNTDRVHIIDAYTGELQPAPFYAPFVVGPGRPIFDGAQIIARRPGRAGVDFVGPDLFVLAGIASRLVPIETRKLLGP
jgi:hypothetical protein